MSTQSGCTFSASSKSTNVKYPKWAHTWNIYIRFEEYKVNRKMIRVLKLVRH